MNISALKFRNFRMYLAGNVFVLNGLWMQRVTLGWMAWDLTSSASFVGMIAFITFAPTMVSGPFFGVLVDRIDIKKAALATQSLLFILALVMFFSYSSGKLTTHLLVWITGITGIVASAYNPVRMALGPRLVDRPALASLITVGAINFNIARLTGPALAGWIIAVWGIGTALFVQALSYLPFIVVIIFLRLRQREDAPTSKKSFFAALADGFKYAVQTPVIRRSLILTLFFAFIIRGVLEILPVLADGVFQKGATGLGILTASAGIGALLAGISKAMLPAQTSGKIPRYTLGVALAGVGLVPLLANSSSWPMIIGLIVLMGFAVSFSAISVQTAIQIELNDHMRGRIMSLWVMAGIGSAATGAAVLGMGAQWFGYGHTLEIVGITGFGLLTILTYRYW